MAWDERYRLLSKGEIVRDGDEFLTDTEWEPVVRTIGRQAPDPAYTSHTWYRRLIRGAEHGND